MQFWKRLRSCLVQTPAHTRVSPEVRPSCSGLQPLMLCELPRMKPAQPLWAVLLSDCPQAVRGNSSSLHPVWTSPISFYVHCHWPSCPTLLEESAPSPRRSPCRHSGLLLRCPKTISAPGWTSPAIPDSPHQRSSRSVSNSILIIFYEIGSIYWCFS